MVDTSGVSVTIDGRPFESVERGLSFFVESFKRAFDRSAKPVRREVLFALEKVVKDMERAHSDPWQPTPRPPSIPRLYRRSGKGIRGIRRSLRVTGQTLGTVTGQVGAKFPMSVHERGATVRAKNAKFLTIPLPAALDSRGLMKRRSARDYENTFVQMSRKGNLLIFQKNSDGTITPLFLLKRRVKIPPRLGMQKSFVKQATFLEQKLIDLFERRLDAI